MDHPLGTDLDAYVTHAGLKIHPYLREFVSEELLPGTGVAEVDFWQGLANIVAEFAPRNRALLAERDRLQAELDGWYRQNESASVDPQAYKAFLRKIGYLAEPVQPFQITTENVDAEIAVQAGPQLVVPVMNARFALNACNARWGSLYDALYGTDVIDEDAGAERGDAYNPLRGERVIAYGRAFLDKHFPLEQGSFEAMIGVRITPQGLAILTEQGETALCDPAQWRGYRGDPDTPEALLLVHHALHVEIQFDRGHPIGASDLAGVKDIVLEAALTTIMDCEDSVAAVDAPDKVQVYRNWLGLMQGDLEENVSKGGSQFVRRMASDRAFLSPLGLPFELPGRSLMFVRNVGHLMTTPAVLTENGDEIPEGILDGVITSAAAIHDLQGRGRFQNSREGSVYIVKPKMHGPQEVAFTDQLFGAIEKLLHLAPNTLKVGIMDEERRTTVNLMACIRAASERVVFINTGFLDRTGDEIHTSMEAGAFARKEQIKSMPWIKAYELHNVAVGLACGLHGKAQIGKGMWAMPDNLAAMMTAKVAQPMAGANTAWVPSPTAATLHAMHYHDVDVARVQQQLLQAPARLDDLLADILTLPLLVEPLTEQDIVREIENNAQGILGYVVRWVEQGVGCSKVPDIDNVGLMEDRATLRISSQHICNWLHHGLCDRSQVMGIMQRMAEVVDRQNSRDPHYRPMARDFQASTAFAAACALVFEGRAQPNGYTEPLLHNYRQVAKGQVP